MFFPCLVLDHDDTVVQSEKTVNYPYFCQILSQFRPGASITLEEYTRGCYSVGFADMCRERFSFTEKEIEDEYLGWKDYIKTHIPEPFPGIGEVLLAYKGRGGKICVVSHSCNENITRDYGVHFGIQPDDIFGWDLPEELRKPSDYPIWKIREKYGFAPEEMLVVDDMKLAYTMAKKQNVPIAFAAWGRQDSPEIYKQMRSLCDYTFDTTADFGRFLLNG